jgi:hypothetical protein
MEMVIRSPNPYWRSVMARQQVLDQALPAEAERHPGDCRRRGQTPHRHPQA